ncbi:MAG: hypothetical protein IIZ78_04965 [Clostridiales bacterium]|nr:hypothetical protein [Clostridiales bacterium]
MATQLGKAYVQIIPSAKGIGNAISSELEGEIPSAGKAAGLNIAGAIKGAIAAAGIAEALKATLEAGGNLQQSFGGLDTLYGDAADAAKKYAVEAASAGISANDFAEQAVSFGASLKAAYGGDMTQAVEAANTAIMDMADNSAKMGTDIGSIQTAYQGFAKQNYTMLDNLKLGYGGTKTEMQRLLADAEKLSGVHYDMDNLGDVYSAIHVIQENLGLTGVAAQEASTTFTGSFGAMKAAAENLMANLALGEDIGPALNTLGQTVNTFLFNNLFPMIGNVLKQVPDLISGVGTMLIQGLNQISANAGDIAGLALNIVSNLVIAIVDAAPSLVKAAVSLIAALGDAFINADWSAIGNNLISSLRNSIDLAAGEILGTDGSPVEGLLTGIQTALPEILGIGVEIITNVANGILEGLPAFVTTAYSLVEQFATFVMQAAPSVLEAGINLLLNLVNGILDNLPLIIDAGMKSVVALLASIASNAPQMLKSGIELIGKLAAGLIQAIPKLVGAIPKIIKSIVDAFKAFDWKTIGIDILKGIADGIINALSLVVDAAVEAGKAIWDSVAGFFKISSPSKLMYYAGEMVDAGFAEGIKDNQGMVTDAISSLKPNLTTSLQTSAPAVTAAPSISSDEKVDDLIALLSAYLPMIANGHVQITLDGDAGRLFRLMQRESIRNTNIVGTNSVLSAT